jgi:hypothetical protein
MERTRDPGTTVLSRKMTRAAPRRDELADHLRIDA